MAFQLKNSSNTVVYSFPTGFNLEYNSISLRQETANRALQHGGVIVGDQKINPRIMTLHGRFGKATYAAMLTELDNMRRHCNNTGYRLYDNSLHPTEYYPWDGLVSFEWDYIGTYRGCDVDIQFLSKDPFRYYQDETTDTNPLSKVLSLNGSGYASIADASQKGLNMGLSDFMIEFWIKFTTSVTNATFVQKGWPGYFIRQTSEGNIEFYLYDGSNSNNIISDSVYNDGEWHYVVAIRDRSGNMEIFVDDTSAATAVTDTTEDLDNAIAFEVGRSSGLEYFIGLIDEIRIWNFGKDGLPADYVDYIAWRYTHPHADISEYNSGAWNGYADALRTNLLTNGDMEAVNSWTDRGTPTTNERSNEQAHAGTYSRKIVTDAVHEGAYQDITTEVGKWYEVDGYIYVTAGDAKIGKEDTDGSDQVLTSQATLGEWTEFAVVFQATETTSRIFFQSDTTANSTFYVDDMSVHKIGLVAHYKFDGDYTDETSNSNDLSAGGTGNSFLLSSLPDGMPITVTNDGNIEVFPVITFTCGAGSDISKIKITNDNDAGKYFEYEPASNLTSGDVVEVDCEEGTVELAGSDDIAHFSGSFIKLAAGDNSITVEITGTVGTSNCEFKFRKRYL